MTDIKPSVYNTGEITARVSMRLLSELIVQEVTLMGDTTPVHYSWAVLFNHLCQPTLFMYVLIYFDEHEKCQITLRHTCILCQFCTSN